MAIVYKRSATSHQSPHCLVVLSDYEGFLNFDVLKVKKDRWRYSYWS